MPILTLAYPQFYLSLFLSCGRPDGKSKKDGEEKENENESVSEHCLLSSGERGHSIPRTFRQINLMTRLENGREARSHSPKNHTQHQPHTVRTHTFTQTNTQAFSYPLTVLCRLTTTQRHKQSWTFTVRHDFCPHYIGKNTTIIVVQMSSRYSNKTVVVNFLGAFSCMLQV